MKEEYQKMLRRWEVWKRRESECALFGEMTVNKLKDMAQDIWNDFAGGKIIHPHSKNPDKSVHKSVFLPECPVCQAALIKLLDDAWLKEQQ